MLSDSTALRAPAAARPLGPVTRRTASLHPPRAWSPTTLALLAAAWLAAVANWPLWRAIAALPEMGGARGLLFGLAMCLIVAALTALPLLLFAWRPLLKPVVAIFLLVAAVAAHFMGSYGVLVDSSMLRNVMQTDVREAGALLSLPLLLNLLLVAGLPIVWLWRQPLRAVAGRRLALSNLAAGAAALGLALALTLLAFQSLSGTMRNHKSLRYLVNPLNSVYALGLLAREAQARPAGPPTPIGLDARALAMPTGARPPLVLLVVGETARADHFSLNGYPRPTNPELARFTDLVSFGRVQSCGTSTAASLPCMFSSLDRSAFLDRAQDSENLLDLLQRAGLAVLWLDNQSGCKGLCDRVPHASTSEPTPGRTSAPAALCRAGECLDEALLYDLDARLAALDPQRRARGTVLVLHQMGSHGPAYGERSPAASKPFQPECRSNVLQDCSNADLVNAFDNSIVYTDLVLGRAIAWLQGHAQSFDAALLYVSDHGESLGENGLYLHGMPYAIAPQAQKQVPMILWTSPAARASLALDGACVEHGRDAALSHDHLFHTVLGLARVRATEYRRELDALAACRGSGG
ncbi:phosphoethanolamine transferase [Rivibacter subsaxonicus]|uniref:Lipid A ethanolaminephosphotransferase n=1 Tax=Rivibacter subsaxonicus TaxID=457575 RepID=A0A4V2FUL7_9BURK|nr:phosphoethanolamine--lipid A transferase [Rivibacter subsaxonicus]RZU02526.1 lipid A ethanolaminephosphotransferase [Rivibacter subsaxonicus]